MPTSMPGRRGPCRRRRPGRQARPAGRGAAGAESRSAPAEPSTGDARGARPRGRTRRRLEARRSVVAATTGRRARHEHCRRRRAPEGSHRSRSAALEENAHALPRGSGGRRRTAAPATAPRRGRRSRACRRVAEPLRGGRRRRAPAPPLGAVEHLERAVGLAAHRERRRTQLGQSDWACVHGVEVDQHADDVGAGRAQDLGAVLRADVVGPVAEPAQQAQVGRRAEGRRSRRRRGRR